MRRCRVTTPKQQVIELLTTVTIDADDFSIEDGVMANSRF
jgi:hypothetical protein